MKYPQLAVFVYFLNAVCSNDAQRMYRKTVRRLQILCDAHNSSSIMVRDPAFDDVLSADTAEFCGPFYATLGEEPSYNNKTINGVVWIKKICKQLENLQDEELTAGALVGFEKLCNATTEAISRSLLNGASFKALARLTNLCLADLQGNSQCADVFADFEVFCERFMNGTAIAVKTAQAETDIGYNIKELDGICHWYSNKFAKEPAEGALGGLSVICEDFEEDNCFPA